MENIGPVMTRAGQRSVALIQAAAAMHRQDESVPNGLLFNLVDEMTFSELKLTAMWMASNSYRMVEAIAEELDASVDTVIGWMGDMLIEREAERGL